jgi:type I restriction enzyme, S subunit
VTWSRASLGELVKRAKGEVRTGPFGSQLHKSDYVEDPTATPVVMPKDMIEGRVDTKSIARIDDSVRDRLKHHMLHAGDIVLARRGEIGRRAWIGDEEEGWLCGTGSMRITLRHSSEIRPRFLYYYLGTNAAVGWLEGHAVGATMSNLSAGVVEQLPVRFPAVDQQDRILNLLDSVEAFLENNRRRIEISEAMARLLYQEWFVHFRFPGHRDAEAIKSHLDPLPAGWTTAPASTALDVNPSERIARDTEHPFIAMGDLTETSMVCFPSETRSRSSGSKFRNGDTLFARITPCLENGKTGFANALADGEIGLGSTEFIVLRGSQVGSEFTYLLARSEDFRQNAIKSMTGASGRQRVRNECFDSYLLAIPPRDLQRRFEDFVRPMFELTFTLARQNRVLREGGDLLLPRLVSGQLDVARFTAELEAVG